MCTPQQATRTANACHMFGKCIFPHETKIWKKGPIIGIGANYVYYVYIYVYGVYLYIYMVYTLRLRYLLFCVYYCTCSNISNSSFSLTPCRNSPGFPFPDLAFSSWLATRGRLQSFQWLDSPGGATKRERETDRPKLKPQITVHPTKMVENSWWLLRMRNSIVGKVTGVVWSSTKSQEPSWSTCDHGSIALTEISRYERWCYLISL